MIVFSRSHFVMVILSFMTDVQGKAAEVDGSLQTGKQRTLRMNMTRI
jgi:hypothetical protein